MKEILEDEELGYLIGGFDMVAEEDPSPDISQFWEPILWEMIGSKNISVYLHAGESD